MTTTQTTADGFDAWMSEQGEPSTTLVDGFEVVDTTPERALRSLGGHGSGEALGAGA